jgi:23S rRNA (adenine2503-C2)-methyltransferase
LSVPEALGMSLRELQEAVGSRQGALAVKRWLHEGGLRGNPPSEIPGLSRRGQEWLRDRPPYPAHSLGHEAHGADGTQRYTLETGGASVEFVLIPRKARVAVCLSCQAGCSRRCAFCATALLGLVRPLTAAEMVLQFVLGSAAHGSAPRNVVFMGMGEPMDNLDEVLRAITHLTEPPLPALSVNRVTVSTSGVVPGMRRFLNEGKGNLALSLNATTDEVRERLMPHTARWPIGALLDVLREGLASQPGRRYFIEYVLLDGVNDTDEDAWRLIDLLAGLPAVVNLIPYNRFPEAAWRPPPPERVARFQRLVANGLIRCLVRQPMGADVAAACGQLALRRASPLAGPETPA